MKLVLDTNFFVLHYFSEGDDSAKTRSILARCRKIGNRGLVSAVVVGEFYTISQKLAGRDVAEKAYNELMNSGLCIADVTPNIAKQSAIFRAKYNESIPWGDCIIAATASVLGADYIVSEDPHFKKMAEINARTVQELRL